MGVHAMAVCFSLVLLLLALDAVASKPNIGICKQLSFRAPSTQK